MSSNSGAAELRSFRYRSTSHDGTLHSGELLAPTSEQAIATLRARGQWPLQLTASVASTFRRQSMPVRELGVGFRVLATILEAKIPAGRVMRVAAPSMPPTWQRSIAAVSAALESGKSFSASVVAGGVQIPAEIDGLLRAGEAAGDLAGALRRSAELAEKSAAMRAAVLDALAYPALLLTAAAGVIGLLVAVVIPRFAEVLTSLGQELPPSTRAVLSIAALIRVGLLPAVVSLVVATAVLARWCATRAGALQWHQLLLSVPVLGELRHAFASARVADALAALLDCGLPVARAIPFAAASSGDSALQARMLDACQRIVEGESIASAFESTRALTVSATRLIGAGEAGGALSALLRHAAVLESERATVRTKSLMRVIEPALILLLGGVVSGVAVALLQAVYSVRVDRL